MIILAFDPGKLTGMAVAEFQNGTTATFIDVNEFSTFTRLPELFKMCDPDVVIYETFHLFPWKAHRLIWDDFVACEVIGVIKHYADISLSPGSLLIGQSPQQKKFFNNARLKELGFNLNSEHKRDAVRHLLYYLKFTLGAEINGRTVFVSGTSK